MGLLDTIRSRMGGGDQDEYDDNGQYYDDQEGYEEDFEDGQYAEDGRYYDEAPGEAPLAGGRRSSAFSTYTPLVSMSDVRSQELPHYSPNSLPAQTGQTAQTGQRTPQQFRTSLPYVGDTAQSSLPALSDFSGFDTGSLDALDQRGTAIYAADEISDPLFQKHSLSNTGDFSATSPAYYASRSGVGHVRPAGQVRRAHRFREVIVVTPGSYGEAEAVATNLRRDNAVVLVLTQTRPELAKRILDFSFGAAAVAEAHVVTISERIYVFTTSHPLTDAEIDLLQSRGVI